LKLVQTALILTGVAVVFTGVSVKEAAAQRRPALRSPMPARTVPAPLTRPTVTPPLSRPGRCHREPLPCRRTPGVPAITTLPQVRGKTAILPQGGTTTVAVVEHRLYSTDPETGERTFEGRYLIRYFGSGTIASDEGFTEAYNRLQEEGLVPTYTHNFVRYESI
jgi:hypothetical protein